MNIFCKFAWKTLQQNKMRTVVSIIGIALSMTMLTAVTLSFGSISDFVVRYTKASSGNWHAGLFHLGQQEEAKLKKDSKVQSVNTLQNIGYARFSNSKVSRTPYLYVGGMDEAFCRNMGITVKSGRMPKNEKEIVLAESVNAYGGKYKTGDRITLSLGKRIKDGNVLWQDTAFQMGQKESYTENVQFQEMGEKSYRIVGFIVTPGFASCDCPGFYAFTRANADFDGSRDCYFTLKDPAQAGAYLAKHWKNYASKENDNLLRYLGASKDSTFQMVASGMMAILLAVIVLGSISLIYNAFAISISERVRQFGILASVGATKRQMRESIFAEAVYLCLAGIPAGMITGTIGIYVTLERISKLVERYMVRDVFAGIRLQLKIAWQPLALAVVIALVTVLLSAWIPSRKVWKYNVIEAISQSREIQINPSGIKTSRITGKLWGIPGILGSKNYKRSRKKYRATVASVFISVVLFVSAAAFEKCLFASVEELMRGADYAVSFRYEPENDRKTIKERDAVLQEITSWKEVKKGGYYVEKEVEIALKKEQFKSYDTVSEKVRKAGSDQYYYPVKLCFIDDGTYRQFLKKNKLDSPRYLSGEAALVKNTFRTVKENGKSKKYQSVSLLKQDPGAYQIISYPEKKGCYYSVNEETEKLEYYSSQTGEIQKTVPLKEAEIEKTLQLGQAVDNEPFCINHQGYAQDVILYYPASAYEKICGKNQFGMDKSIFAFCSDSHKQLTQKLSQYLQQTNVLDANLQDIVEGIESDMALIKMIKVFANGFVILLCLIAVANIFNTISTNMILRKREFAMLRSVGMTMKEFYRMMQYECLLYSVRGLVYGLPAAFLIIVLMNKVLNTGWQRSFLIPWQSIGLVIVGVFLVVFITMLYTARKIKKENIMDALRNENV